jgi:hypothetical protein
MIGEIVAIIILWELGKFIVRRLLEDQERAKWTTRRL